MFFGGNFQIATIPWNSTKKFCVEIKYFRLHSNATHTHTSANWFCGESNN